MSTMSYQMKTINNEIEMISKRTKGKFWSWKIQYLKFFKNPLEGLHSRAELTGERISEHEDSLVAIVYAEEQKGKKRKNTKGASGRTAAPLRTPAHQWWDTRGREKGAKTEEIMAKDFLNSEKQVT